MSKAELDKWLIPAFVSIPRIVAGIDMNIWKNCQMKRNVVNKVAHALPNYSEQHFSFFDYEIDY
jgi:hypothetical protein